MNLNDLLPDVDRERIDRAEMIIIDHGNGVMQIVKDRFSAHPLMLPIEAVVTRLRGRKRAVDVLWVHVSCTKPEPA